MRRIAVIDIDSIIYAVACTSEVLNKADGTYLPTRTAEAAYEEVADRLRKLVRKVQADDAIICLSYTNCFRYKLLPTYKGNRTNRKPEVLLELQRLVADRKPYRTLQVVGLEADDVAGITAGALQAQGREPVICSIDKDLRQIPGLLFQGEKVEEITEEYADRWHLYQALIGDPTDNYTGCPGVGPKKAAAILDQPGSAAERWARVLEAFKSRGYGEDYALTQARVSRILRASDWDGVAKEPILWEPPKEAKDQLRKAA